MKIPFIFFPYFSFKRKQKYSLKFLKWLECIGPQNATLIYFLSKRLKEKKIKQEQKCANLKIPITN